MAGLGTFGLNNMLITAAGCCGRLSTVVTNLRVTADTPLLTENCLYKKSGRCGLCVKRCPSGALNLPAMIVKFASSYVKKMPPFITLMEILTQLSPVVKWLLLVAKFVVNA